jgi:hypothetical protein
MAWTVGGSVYCRDFYLAAEGVNIEELNKRKREYFFHEELARARAMREKTGSDFGHEIGLVSPPEFLPRVARLTKGKKLYDYGSQGEVGPVVSARFKAAHDKIQPSGNQFIPIKILNKDGSAYEGEFYVFQITTVLDAIDPSLGGFETRDKGENVTYYPKSGTDNVRNRLAVHKDRLVGKAAWRDLRFGGTIYDFFSDAFLDELAVVNAAGFDKNYHFHEL